MKKITIIAKKLNMEGGGSDFSIHLLSQMLNKNGIKVLVIPVCTNRNSLPSNRNYQVSQPEERLAKTRIGEFKQVYEIMKTHQYESDLFHIFTPAYFAIAGFFRRNHKSPPVVGRLNTYNLFCTNHSKMTGECHKNCNSISKMSHDSVGVGKKIAKTPLYLIQNHLEPYYANEIDKYFAISPSVKKIYCDTGLDPEKIEVIPNFYDPDFTRERSDSDGSKFRNTGNSDLEILYVGRLAETKGTEMLIRAVAELPSTQLKIVGDGPLMNDLVSLSKELSIDSQVEFEGQVPYKELSKYYIESDIFVHPAQWPEPFGRTVLESLQHGTPAVVSDMGAPSWIVGEAGKSFNSDSPRQLISILSDLQDSPEKISRMSANCDNTIERFSPNTILEKIISEYNSLF